MISPYVYPGLPLKHGYTGLINKLNKYVSYCSNISVDDLKSKKRVSHINRARQVCMYVLKKHTNLTLQEIGKEYCRDHSTVLHSVRTIENELLYDADLRDTVLELKRELAYLHPKKYNLSGIKII